MRTPSLGEVYPKIFSHNKDRVSLCPFELRFSSGIMQAVFCVFLKITDVRSCLDPIFYRRWRFVLKNRLSLFRRKNMAYKKPQVIAQNASSGSYAAGCGANVQVLVVREEQDA